MIKHIWAVYFSPSGKTEQVTMAVAEGAAGVLKSGEIHTCDFTLPDKREHPFCFGEEDLVILGCPTYAGRIPNKIMPFIRDRICGHGASVAIVMTYGGRSIDHSVMEAYLLLQENGFKVYGAGSAVTRHVMSDILSAGRPRTEDLKEAGQFGEDVVHKIMTQPENYNDLRLPGSNPVGHYYKPLEADGTPANFLKAKPKVHNEICTHCKICAEVCPMGSISRENIEEVPGVCIKCHACVRKCPTGARFFDDPSLISHIRMLEENFAGQPKDNNWYL